MISAESINSPVDSSTELQWLLSVGKVNECWKLCNKYLNSHDVFRETFNDNSLEQILLSKALKRPNEPLGSVKQVRIFQHAELHEENP